MLKRFAEYRDSAENRRKLTIRLGIFTIAGGIIFNLVMLYALVFLKK